VYKCDHLRVGLPKELENMRVDTAAKQQPLAA